MDKSPEAFRTISEVADTLDTPAHVLRFWESRFPQIRPVKRAGGRRYYRPADVALLTGIKRLLHEEGMTIRGVQKILREQGVRHVSGLTMSSLAEIDPAEALEEAMAERFGAAEEADVVPAEVETAQVFALETALRKPSAAPAPRAPDLPMPDLFDFAGLEPSPTAMPVSAPEEAPFVVMAEPGAEEARTEGAAAVAAELEPEPEPVPEPVLEEASVVDEPAVAAEPVPVPEPVLEAAFAEEAPAVAVEPEPGPAPEPERVSAPLTVSRGAMLRALPLPLREDMQAALPVLRHRLAALRDRQSEAERQPGRVG